MLIRRCALFPEPGSARTLAAATLANTIGTGIWLSGSALFFTRSVGLSAAQLGVGISTAGVFGLAAAIPLGHLADRRGPSGVAVVLLLLSAVATCGYALVHSFAVFVVLVSIDAVAQAGGLAARGALIAAIFSSEARVRTLAYLRAVSNLGISLGTVAAGVALRADTRAAYSHSASATRRAT